MQHYIIILSILKALTVVVGMVFLYYTWKAYRKSHARSLLVLFVAVALMVAAAVAEGAAFQMFGMSLDQAHVVEAVVTLAAFTVLIYSIMARQTT